LGAFLSHTLADFNNEQKP